MCISQLKGLYDTNDLNSPTIGIDWEAEWRELEVEVGSPAVRAFDLIMWSIIVELRDPAFTSKD